MPGQFISAALFAVVLFSSHAALAAPGEEWFLSHREFSNLTPVEQKKYLKEVQRILGRLPEMSDYFADGKKIQRRIAGAAAVSAAHVLQDLEQAEKWKGEIVPIREFQRLQNNAAEFRDNFENSLWWVASARLHLQTVPKEDPRRAEAEERLKKIETFYEGNRAALETSVAKNRELAAPYDILAKTKKGELTLDKAAFVFNEKLVDHGSKERRSLAQSSLKKSEPPPAAASPQKNLQAEIPAAKTGAAERSYRCMYAGFILKNDPCRGPSSLPEEMKLYGFDRSKTCGSGQVLCNPLVFGLDLDCVLTENSTNEERKVCLAAANPLCVNRGKFATRECGENSTDNHLWSAATLIVSNPEAWEDYLTGFYELCDDKKIASNEFALNKNGRPREFPQKTLRDIDQTCKAAKGQLKKLANAYNREAEEKVIRVDRPKGSPRPAIVPDVDEDGRPDEGFRGQQ